MTRVLVAISGGVDSSVAAALMVEQYGPQNVWLVHMKLHNQTSNSLSIKQQKTCCGTTDALDARTVARKLGAYFDVIDFSKEFNDIVIQNFIDEYKLGRTPIPCTHCNGSFKFDLLVKLATKAGFDYVATGHYARTVDNTLLAAASKEKDQSYFLWPVPKVVLPKIKFPLGELSKAEVRQLAHKYELVTADKQESMDLCFVPDGDRSKLLGDGIKGPIVHHITREVIGEHTGYQNYTVGQRKGLNISNTEALFVKKISFKDNTLYVAPRGDLPESGFLLSGENWFSSTEEELLVRLRHNGKLHRASVFRSPTIKTIVRLLSSSEIIAPGQAAVFYRGDQVVGGGWISS